MATQASIPSELPAASDRPRWFVGMLAEVKASAADTGGQYTLVEVTAPPNLRAPLHVHYTEDEGFYVLDGTVTIQVGEETVELGPGRHAHGPRNIPHRFTVGPDGARMLWILTPGGFENLLEAASVPAEAATVPPPSVVRPRTSPRSSCATATNCCPAEPTDQAAPSGGGPPGDRAATAVLPARPLVACRA